tara:strand:- start:915 stop:2546 length:1632 start_codon:yes stop_codon:yes gene_type:complete
MRSSKLVGSIFFYVVLSATLDQYVKAQAVYDYDLGTYLSPEQEPNNTPENSTPLTVGFNTYDDDDEEQTLRGVFGMKGNISEGDEDWFVISMETGMVMRFTDGLDESTCKPEIYAIQSVTETSTNLGLIYKGNPEPNYEFISFPAGKSYIRYDSSCFGDYFFKLQETGLSYLNYEMELVNDYFSYAQEIPLHYDPVSLKFKYKYFDESPVDRLSPNSVDWPNNKRPPVRKEWVSRTSLHKYREPNQQSTGGDLWNAAITGGSVNAQSHSASDYDWFKVELINTERKDFHLWFSADNQGVEESLCEWNIQYYGPDQRLLLDMTELASISGSATAHESEKLESIKPGVLDSLDAVFVLIFPTENNFCDIPYRINFAAKKAKAEVTPDTYSGVIRWMSGTDTYTWWDSNDLASGPLKLLLDETENSIWKENSYKFFEENNVSASQVLVTPISYFSENQIWVKNLLYDKKQYDLSLLLGYEESGELVLTVNSASESEREMDGITPALEGMLLFVPYFRYGQAVYRMTLELIDTKALKFKLNEFEQRY